MNQTIVAKAAQTLNQDVQENPPTEIGFMTNAPDSEQSRNIPIRFFKPTVARVKVFVAKPKPQPLIPTTYLP